MQRRRYYFNDGEAGIVVARSLNQAIKILASHAYLTKSCRAMLRKEIKKDIKKDPCGELLTTDWVVESELTNDKTGFKGWIE